MSEFIGLNRESLVMVCVMCVVYVALIKIETENEVSLRNSRRGQYDNETLHMCWGGDQGEKKVFGTLRLLVNKSARRSVKRMVTPC